MPRPSAAWPDYGAKRTALRAALSLSFRAGLDRVLGAFGGIGGLRTRTEALDGPPIAAQQMVGDDLHVAGRILEVVPLSAVLPESPGTAGPGAEWCDELKVCAEVGEVGFDRFEMVGDCVHQEAHAEDAESVRETGLARRFVPSVGKDVAHGSPEGREDVEHAVHIGAAVVGEAVLVEGAVADAVLEHPEDR